MKQYLERILVGLFFIGAVALFISTSVNRPRVFVLHSYDPEYSWTRDVTVGLKRVLDPRKDYSIRWHYMDLKRYPWPEYKESAGLRARKAIDDFGPDVLIAVDDDAQEHAAKYFVDHPKTKIVFAGINGGIEPYGYDKATNVTGVLERKQAQALRQALVDEAIKSPTGGPGRLLFIGDTSGSVKSDMEYLAKIDWQPMQFAGIKLAKSYDEWQSIIANAKGIADVIVTTNYRKIARESGKKELVPAEELIAWSERNTDLPLIGTNGFFVEDGGSFAIATSAYEQGEVAGRMATLIIDKKMIPTSIPVESTKQFVVYLRTSGLAKKSLRLPPIYESFARATNNFYE